VSDGARAYSAIRSSGDSSSDPSAGSQRSAPRTSTKRLGAIIGTVRAAESTLSTGASPAVNLSSLNAAMPEPSAPSRIAETSASRRYCSDPEIT